MGTRRKVRSQSHPSPVRAPGLVFHADPKAVRSYHVRTYKSQLQSLNNASEKLRRFVEIDQPAFTLWWQQEFAGELTQQMKLERILSDLELLTDAVEQYKVHYRCPYPRAYTVVLKAQEEGQLGALMRKIFAEIDQTHRDQYHIDILAREAQAERERKVRPDTKAQEPRTAEDLPPQFEKIAAVTPEETTDHYIKKIYRELVVILHPDTREGGEQNTSEKALWLELQNAYEWRDLDRMEAIFKAVHGTITSALNFETIPIGDIVSMKEAVAIKLEHLRRDLKQAKKEANWDFQQKRQKRSFLIYLAKSIQNELIEHTMILEHRIEKLQKRVQSWETARTNQKQTSSRRIRVPTAAGGKPPYTDSRVRPSSP